MHGPLIDDLTSRLARIDGVAAVALGGSRAAGLDRPDSDFDLGLYYRDAAPFSVRDIAALAEQINDEASPVVTDFYCWGPWVNGGAWLTVKGRRVDFLYRSLDRLEQVIEDCLQGRIESDHYQQPPYGFHSYIYLGELSVCRPLFDPPGVLAALKARLVPYPPALRRAIIDRFLWGVEFDLSQAGKLAARGDVYSAAGCFARCAAGLVQVLYGLNERYFLNDKHALHDIDSFPLKPAGLVPTLKGVLAAPGASAAALSETASRLAGLLRDTTHLCGDLYQRPDFRAAADA